MNNHGMLSSMWGACATLDIEVYPVSFRSARQAPTPWVGMGTRVVETALEEEYAITSMESVIASKVLLAPCANARVLLCN